MLWTSDESDLLFDLFGKDDHVNNAFRNAKWRPGRMTWLQRTGVERDEFLQYLGLGLNALFTSRSQPARWIDQTPVNTLIVDVLAEMFPSALFLHILRDSRRVINSMMHFNDKLDEDLKTTLVESDSLPSWSVSFREGCKTWRFFVERSMDFCALHPARCLTVTNEALVENPHQGFKRVCEFVDVPYEDGPAAFFQANRINSSFGPSETPGVPGPPLAEPWKEWTQEQRAIYLEEVGSTLTRYGLAMEDELRSQLT